MITNILFFAWFLLIVLILSAIARKLFSHSTIYSFQDWEKMEVPYIILNIQGEDFNMITDSAASVSVIKKDALKRLSSYTPIPRAVCMTALTDESVDSSVVSIPININGKEVKSDFVVYNSDDFGNWKLKSGIEIHGLLGVEFLRKTNGIVDFNTKTVKFP